MTVSSINQLESMVEVVKKLLRVALIGAPNAGKSTLLNRLVMGEVSCVSNKVHTTRQNVLGVYTENDTQLEFFDSPGTITRQHVLKHHLEDSLLQDPVKASKQCDLIGVVVDATNLRECKRLNRSILSILRDHQDKKSFLILNKVDLVKEKRILLDIGNRLSEGHLDGKCVIPKWELGNLMQKYSHYHLKSTSPYVINLDQKSKDELDFDESSSSIPLGYRNFSRIFSISALQDDGVDTLREEMMQLAQPVSEWPHGPHILSDQSTKDVVHAIVRGHVMDNVDHEIPYLVQYRYLQCKIDELGSLHIDLELLVPKRYMVGKLLGQQGSVIFKITNESREKIQNQLGCDTKLNITVNCKGK